MAPVGATVPPVVATHRVPIPTAVYTTPTYTTKVSLFLCGHQRQWVSLTVMVYARLKVIHLSQICSIYRGFYTVVPMQRDKANIAA